MESNHILDQPTPLRSLLLPTFRTHRTSNFLQKRHTPWKINGWFTYKSPMKRKENESKPNLREDMFQALIFWGVSKVANMFATPQNKEQISEVQLCFQEPQRFIKVIGSISRNQGQLCMMH